MPASASVQDEELLELAHAEGRAVVTLNRWDFVRLHAERPGHAGIIVCTFDRDFVALARRIDDTIRAAALDGKLIRVNRPRS
jgi:predicted nuclease of predicted toxin-antitoxin system